ncbi:MAG: TIGR00725 family protein [Candidatus Tectomicrobia bacterium]|uniref:TIGR00725 family protein n=1 Tax=Tectimicrobiota bacterium TaxID=2528274 RepID=A0A932GP65_UNCTE|nr:TIGR00725 family protein [Candidatus Tectomicrobia bacterium]
MRTVAAVIGGGVCDQETTLLAEKVGEQLAERGVVLVCGGLGGVMEAAARGAKRAGGTTVGILPGFSAQEANPYIDIPIVTGLSHARNAIVVRSAKVVIALPGEYGTLSEIALALKMRIPVIALNAWYSQEGVIHAKTPEEAIQKALKSIPGLADGNR